MKQYFETSVYDKAYAYALDLAVAANIHIVKMNNNGEYLIANETKVKDLTIEDLQHDIMRRYFYGQYSADDIFNYDSIIAEDGFVTLYNKSGQPYPYYFADFTEEEKAELDKNPVIGGRYDYVKYCNAKSKNRDKKSEYDVHHIISAEAIRKTGFLNFNTGPCIRILKSDHKFTKSYGPSKDAKYYRNHQIKLIKQGKIRELVIEEVQYIRLRFGSKYNNELSEMLRYVKQLENNNWKVEK
ncbi:MAG: hypothetical protein VZR11_09575 [Succinimonas sp.]|nr:hypothetical protein [Succinimonas sp.]